MNQQQMPSQMMPAPQQVQVDQNGQLFYIQQPQVVQQQIGPDGQPVQWAFPTQVIYQQDANGNIVQQMLPAPQAQAMQSNTQNGGLVVQQRPFVNNQPGQGGAYPQGFQQPIQMQPVQIQQKSAPAASGVQQQQNGSQSAGNQREEFTNVSSDEANS